jgi:hypothetical protein
MTAIMTKDEIARDKLDTLIVKLRKAEEQHRTATVQHQRSQDSLKQAKANVVLIENEIAEVVRKELPGAAKALRRKAIHDDRNDT